jgi:transcriptional regulator with XRE-family HTH domain
VLGAELRKARLAAQLTQEELAFRAGVSRNYISLLELDEKSPTVQTLFRVAKALNIRASKLIQNVENQEIKP